MAKNFRWWTASFQANAVSNIGGTGPSLYMEEIIPKIRDCLKDVAALCILFGALLFLPRLTLAQSFSTTTLSVADLIAYRDTYDGKQVQLVGWVHLEKPPLAEEVSDAVYQDQMAFQKNPSPANALNLVLRDNYDKRNSFTDSYQRVQG